MVANELGFRQMLPQKRDSVVEDQIVFPTKPQANGMNLGLPQIDISRSASPVLEPMSARITDDAANMVKAVGASEDPQLLRMSARVGA